jgi:coenzyme F420-reducing hydrogenase alpha subunit
LAQVEAARGRLVHGVEIEDGIVRRYAILAPTEWNFHSDGGAALGLADIAGRERDAREIADLFVTTVDPCVGYELRVH